jgi:hypothetical protein
MSSNDPGSGPGNRPPPPGWATPGDQPPPPPPPPRAGGFQPPAPPPPHHGGFQPAPPSYSPTAWAPYGYAPQQMQRTNGLAIASLVLGIVWIYWIGSILAVIFGHVALGQIKRSNNTQTGGGLAIAGLVLGYIGLAFFVLFLVLAGALGGSSTTTFTDTGTPIGG